MIDGQTRLIAHIGHPTHTFKSPMIYNPYFEAAGINAVVVPMDCTAQHFEALLKAVFSLGNIIGALITMPHKVSVVGLLDQVTATVRVAGACNAVRRTPDGRLEGDMFDGAGFVRGIVRKGFDPAGRRALVVGSGGVGSAIAASLAGAGVGAITLFDVNALAATQLAARLRMQYPAIDVGTGHNDPAEFDLVVNASPLGMNDGDPLPIDVARLSADTFVGEVVMKHETTAFLAAAQARGCRTQVGTDMLFEQIPAYLEFFGLPSTTAEQLRQVARVRY
ncbi:MAG: shikimate dehydrogenase [Betaproteobacteria bacterium]|nr:shikimate dehydrogenase [Betaproteobacteria bacterium]